MSALEDSLDPPYESGRLQNDQAIANAAVRDLRQERRLPASLEVRKVYRTLPDTGASAKGFVRVVDESGDDYLYPADHFISITLPKAAEDALLTAS